MKEEQPLILTKPFDIRSIEDANTVMFRFALHKDVFILPLKLTGRVFAQCRRGEGFNEYRVIFWYDGKREDQWLFEHELAEPKF